jgi:hypothetical protein
MWSESSLHQEVLIFIFSHQYHLDSILYFLKALVALYKLVHNTHLRRRKLNLLLQSYQLYLILFLKEALWHRHIHHYLIFIVFVFRIHILRRFLIFSLVKTFYVLFYYVYIVNGLSLIMILIRVGLIFRVVLDLAVRRVVPIYLVVLHLSIFYFYRLNIPIDFDIHVARVLLEFLKFLLFCFVDLIIILCQFFHLVKVVLMPRANTRAILHKLRFFNEQLWLLKLFKSHIFKILNINTAWQRYEHDPRFLRLARLILFGRHFPFQFVSL